jgi:hypothetical protein
MLQRTLGERERRSRVTSGEAESQVAYSFTQAPPLRE